MPPPAKLFSHRPILRFLAKDLSPRDYFKNKRRYSEVGELGVGGMAKVYEFNDEYFHRHIAYKALKSPHPTIRQVKAFVREAKIMARLEHPAITPIYDLTTSDDLPVITMDKIEGITLSEKIIQVKKKPSQWPLSERVNVFAKLVEVLNYSHHQGILHRDLKPSNIMLGHYGEVTLLDWGLAKVLSEKVPKSADKVDKQYQSMQGVIKGTPYYMSPEAARGLSESIDEKSDIFSLGAILFELITLEYLIRGKVAMEVLKNAQSCSYREIKCHPSGKILNFDGLGKEELPREILHILNKCIAQSSENRYHKADQLLEDIYCYQSGLPLAGFENTAWHRFKKRIGRDWGGFLFYTFPPLLIATLIYFLWEAKDLNSLNHSSSMQAFDQSSERLNRSKNLIEDLANKEKKLTIGLQLKDTEKSKYKNLISLLSQSHTEKAQALADSKLKYLQMSQNRDHQLKEHERLSSENNKLKKELQIRDQAIRKKRRSLRFDYFLKKAPELAHSIQEAEDFYISGHRLRALKELDAPALLDDPFAAKLLSSMIHSSFETIKKRSGVDLPPLKEKTEPPLNDFLLNLGAKLGKTWDHLLVDSGDTILFASDGSVLKVTPDKSFKALYKHSFPVKHVAVSKNQVYGIYKNNIAFWQNGFAQPAYKIYHPKEITGIQLREGALMVEDRSRVTIYRFKFTLDKNSSYGWFKPLQRDDDFLEPSWSLKPKIPIIPDLPHQEAALAQTSTGQILTWSLSNSGIDINLLDSDHDLIQNWKVLGLHLTEALVSSDQRWIVLTNTGQIYHLRKDQPSRHITLATHLSVHKIFSLPLLNLVLIQDSQMNLSLIYHNTGQTLFTIGQLKESILRVAEGEGSSIILECESGNLYQLGH